MKHLALFFCLLTPALLMAAPPNVILFIADDVSASDLGCYGSRTARTPHIDRLAREGTDFHQFNVLNPVCSPSRTAVMTGMYPARYCIHGHFATPASNAQRGMPDWLDTEAPTNRR